MKLEDKKTSTYLHILRKKHKVEVIVVMKE
jgi:hypothetical protein